MTCLRLLAALLGVTTAVQEAAAQDSVRASLPRFELPFADPRMYALGARVLAVTRADSKLGEGTQVDVVLGEDLPLIALRRGEQPISLGLGASVTGRFSLSDRRNTFISSDWNIELNVNAMLGRWNLAGGIRHESSHLGDEYIAQFQADDAHWSRDGLSGWAFYHAAPWRFGVSANWAWKDVAGRAKWGAAAGIDLRSPHTRILGLRLAPRAGAYVEANAFTDWDPAISGKVGVAFPVAAGPECTISLTGFAGPSPQRQFYDVRTDYVAIEFRFDL
jgi:hypothetical protein